MGAGSGRDAAWFAANGYSVVAAEPAAGMRRAGKALHSSPDIRWMDDALPAAEKAGFGRRRIMQLRRENR